MKLTSLCFPSGARARMAISAPTALGRITLVHLTSQSWALPGSAQRCLLTRRREADSAIVSEDVLFGPPGDVEERARWKKIKAGLRQRGPVLALETLVELHLQLVKVANVACRIFALSIAQFRGAPVAC